MRRYRIGCRLIGQLVAARLDREVRGHDTAATRNIGNGKMVVIVHRQGYGIDIVRRHIFPLDMTVISERLSPVVKVHVQVVHTALESLGQSILLYLVSDGEIVTIGHIVVDATARQQQQGRR